MANNILFIYLAALVAVVSSASIASDLKTCSVLELSSGCVFQFGPTSLSKLLGGITELNIESFDPFHMEKLQYNLTGLTIDLKELTLKGFKNVKIEDLSVNLKTNKLNFNGVIPDVTFDISGRVIGLPIPVDGQATFRLEELKLTSTFDIEKYEGIDGKQRIRVKNANIQIINGQVTVTSFIDEEKLLSNVMHTLSNTTMTVSNDLSNELGGPIIQEASLNVVEMINGLLAAVTLENLIKGAQQVIDN